MFNDNTVSKMNFHITGYSSSFSADTTPEFYYYSLFADGKLIGKITHNMETGYVVVYCLCRLDGKSGWISDSADSIQDAINSIKECYSID
jgi:hypothetical protein